MYYFNFNKSSCFSIFFGCLVGAFANSAPSYANSNSGPVVATFDSSQAQSFTLDLTLINATVSVGGGGKVKDVLFGSDITFNLGDSSNQNKPLSLNGGTVQFNSAPNGSATLGFDHSNPNGPGRTISSLDVDFRNGANWAFSFNEVTFDVGSSLGSYNMGLTISANLNQFGFDQDTGAAPVDSFGFFNTPGVVSAGFTADVDARIKDIALGSDVNLGNIASFNESTLSAFDFPGREILTPQGAFPSGPFPQDLLAELGLDLSSFPISFPFDSSGVATENNNDVEYNIPYTITGTLVISNLTYALQDTLQDTLVGAVIPEPATLLLAALGFSGIWASRRRRQRRTPT